jgi:hypothetical protein
MNVRSINPTALTGFLDIIPSTAGINDIYA